MLILANQNLHRYERMQGFPPLHCKLFPVNSPEDHLQEEFHEENYFEAQSVVTPLIRHPEGDNFQEGFVVPKIPPLIDPFDPVLI
jgi:hypothetical protein